MRKIIVSVFFIISPFFINYAYTAEVRFVISKTHSLFYFLNSLAQGQTSKTLKIQFDKSKFNTPQNRSKIVEYKALKNNLSSGYGLGKYPPNRHSGHKNIFKVLEVRSIQAKDLNDFSIRIIGLLPNDLHSKLLKNLQYWNPIFSDLIWEPNLKKLKEYRDRISLKATHWKMNQTLNQAIHFTNATWPSIVPFTVSLIPLKTRLDTSTHGHSSGAFETVEVVLDKMKDKELVNRYGVIVHELIHSIYYSQSSEFQQKFYSWFKESKSNANMFAYKLFNEGLATTIGNGIAFEIANGVQNDGEWYADEFIDQFAKAINSLTKKYISKKKIIDKEYVNSIIKHHKKLFPNASRNIKNIFQTVILHGDGECFTPNSIIPEIRKYHSLPSAWMFPSIRSERARKKIKNSTDSVIFVLLKDYIDQIDWYKDKVEGIDDLKKAIANNKGSILFSFMTKNNRAFLGLIVDSNDKDKLEKLFGKVFAMKEIPQRRITIF